MMFIIVFMFLLLFSSSLIVKIFIDAHEAGKMFHVVVVDARPKFEGIFVREFSELVRIIIIIC